MANHPSAEKRHRQNLKRRERNRAARSEIRTSIKSTIKALRDGNTEEAQASARKAASLLDKAVARGLLHKNNARRRISRLQRRISAPAQ